MAAKLTKEEWLDDLIGRGRALYDACGPISRSAEAATEDEWVAFFRAIEGAALFTSPNTIKAALSQHQGGTNGL